MLAQAALRGARGWDLPVKTTLDYNGELGGWLLPQPRSPRRYAVHEDYRRVHPVSTAEL